MLRQSANKRLTEVHVFVVELHGDRKRLREVNLILCQKNGNKLKGEVYGYVGKMSRIKWLVKQHQAKSSARSQWSPS